MKKKATTAARLEALLKDWGTLNRGLLKLTEGEAQELLLRERQGKNRTVHVLRIHQRLNKLRRQRERVEILQEAK